MTDDLAVGMYRVRDAARNGASALEVLRAAADGAREQNEHLDDLTQRIQTRWSELLRRLDED